METEGLLLTSGFWVGVLDLTSSSGREGSGASWRFLGGLHIHPGGGGVCISFGQWWTSYSPRPSLAWPEMREELVALWCWWGGWAPIASRGVSSYTEGGVPLVVRCRSSLPPGSFPLSLLSHCEGQGCGWHTSLYPGSGRNLGNPTWLLLVEVWLSKHLLFW